MTTPDSGGFIQGLLSSIQPWTTGGSPGLLSSQYGGTSGLMDALLQAGGPNTTYSNMGRALTKQKALALDEAASRQGLAQQNLGLQFMASRMPLILQRMRQAAGYGGQQQPSAQPTALTSDQISQVPPMIRATPRQLSTQAASAPPQQPQPSTGGGNNSQSLLDAAQFDAMWNPQLANTERGIAALQMQYDPNLATQQALAKNVMTQDMAGYQRALQSGDQTGAKAWYMRYLQDSGLVNVAKYNGTTTTFGGFTPQALGISTLNPSTGIGISNGNASAVNGYPAARQQIAGAEAKGAAEGKVVNVGGVPIPLTDVLGGGPANSGGAGTQSPALHAPPGGPGGNPFLRLLGQAKYTTDTAEQSANLGKIYQEGADAARTTNYALDQMLQDAKGASLGPAANFKEWLDKKGAGLAQLFGVKGVATPQLDSYQQLDKYGNQVAFAAARQMGSREAAQVVQLQMESNPNKTLTPNAFSDLAGSMKAMNNYIIAKNLAVQQQAQQNGGNLELASAQWTKAIDPRVWDLTLSPAMGEKWAASIGKDKIEAAWPYLTGEEQKALIGNIPASVRAQWLK